MKVRTVHINDQEWKYAVGKTYVPIWDPEDKKTVVEITRLPGYRKWFDNEENRIGFSEPFRITPGKIKTYIEQQIMK